MFPFGGVSIGYIPFWVVSNRMYLFVGVSNRYVPFRWSLKYIHTYQFGGVSN